MNPAAVRVAILVTELIVFLTVTAFTAYFISHASAVNFAAGEALPAQFPVIAYVGNRDRPEAKNYRVMPWNEWEGTAEKQPGASLLLPERFGTVRIGDSGEATFTVADEAESRQTVDLTWRTGGGEQQVRYVAQARTIEARYMRTLGTHTLLMGAAAGFVAGLFAGRALRRRWLAQPARFSPPPPRAE